MFASGVEYTHLEGDHGEDIDVRGFLVMCLLHCQATIEDKQQIYEDLCHYIHKYQKDDQKNLTES